MTEMNLQAVWPSGLRRRIQAPFRKGEGSNPSTVNNCFFFAPSLSLPPAFSLWMFDFILEFFLNFFSTCLVVFSTLFQNTTTT